MVAEPESDMPEIKPPEMECLRHSPDCSCQTCFSASVVVGIVKSTTYTEFRPVSPPFGKCGKCHLFGRLDIHGNCLNKDIVNWTRSRCGIITSGKSIECHVPMTYDRFKLKHDL